MNKTVLKEIETDYAAMLIVADNTSNLYFEEKADKNSDIKKFCNYNVTASNINKKKWFLKMEV